MKQALGGFLLMLLVFSSAGAPADTGSEITGVEGDQEQERQRREWFESQRAYPALRVPPDAKLHAWEALKKARQSVAAPSAEGPAAAAPWVNIGPAPQLMSGSGLPYSNRIEHLAADPGNTNHWLVSAPRGGLWETLDAGATWTPRTDDMPSLATGAVAFSASNPLVVYSGIGESGVGGLLKSIDGGTNWQLLATAVFTQGNEFREIRVDPTDPSTLYAATGSFFGNSSAGIWKSIDGGSNWTHLLHGRAMDLEVNPGNMNQQYTILGGGYADAEDGVYRYDGTSWTLLSGPWGTLTGNSGVLAIAPANANVMYVSIRDKGIWKSTNAWAASPAWTAVPNPLNIFFDDFVVDRVDSDVLWGGDTYFYKFDGNSWTELTRADQINGLHVDLRYIAWAGTRLLLGNDGGVFSTLDAGAHWLDHNTNLSITQFYAGSLHPSNGSIAMGGSQDDGTARWTGTNPWATTTWGDGMANFFAANSPDTSWATSYQGLNILRTLDGGVSYPLVSNGIDPANRPFFGKFDKCAANENIVIAGSHALWKTMDFFAATEPSWSTNGPEMNDPISAVALAPSSSNCQIYAYGNTNSELRLTANGGVDWANLDPVNAVPGRSVTDIAFHPADPSTLYVTLSGYDENTPGQPGHLFKGTNALPSGYLTTTVSLPPAADGQNVRLRWRMASDSSVAAVGWSVDTIVLSSPGFSQDFDGVAAPALPADWTTSTLAGATNLWVTNDASSDTEPNHAFAADPGTVSDSVLVSPSIAIPAGGAQLTFRNFYNTEFQYDGGVLEIAIGAGAFEDIVTAGGTFLAGGYSAPILLASSSPLAGRNAWTGFSAPDSAWSDISPPDSNVPFNTVALDPLNPSSIYVGTDLGIWHSPDGGTSWSHMGPEVGVPNTIVHDLKFGQATNTLMAFSYGRGAFKLGGALNDTDADGVPDALDNCSTVANPTQCDSDADGYGNRCDGDLNNNSYTNAQDYILLRGQLGQPSVAPTYNSADLNCNGFANAQDYVLFRGLIGSPPGPSGLHP